MNAPDHHRATRSAAARLNPFRVERVESLPFRFTGEDWPAARRRLEALGWRGAIVGPEGSGKTTLLLELATRLEAEGRETTRLLADGCTRVGREEFRDSLAAVRAARGLVLLDGADRFSPVQWWRFRRAARAGNGLVTTLHRPGRWPTWVACTPSPALFATVVVRLVTDVGSEVAPRDELDRLFARHRGNMRAALRALYDGWAVEHTPRSA